MKHSSKTFSSILPLVIALIGVPSAYSASLAAKGQMAPTVSFTVAGRPMSVSAYRGHKIVLFLLSTWCQGCMASVDALATHKAQFKKDGVQVIALKNYKDNGYPGPSIENFAKNHASSVVHAGNWVFGQAPALLSTPIMRTEFPISITSSAQTASFARSAECHL